MDKRLALRAMVAIALLSILFAGVHAVIAALCADRIGFVAWLAGPEGRADLVFGGLSVVLGLGSLAIGIRPRPAAAMAILCTIIFGSGTHATQSLLMPSTSLANRIAPRFVALPSIAVLRPRVRVDIIPAVPGRPIHEG